MAAFAKSWRWFAGGLAALLCAGGLVAVWRMVPPWLASKMQVRAGLMTLQPKVLPQGVANSLPKLAFGQVEVDAQVFVRNGTWLDLTLHDVKWRAQLSGRQVAQGSLPRNQKLPSDREEPVKLHAVISAPALGLALADMLRIRSADVAIEVDATAGTFGLAMQRSFRVTGFDLRLDPGDVDPLKTMDPSETKGGTRSP